MLFLDGIIVLGKCAAHNNHFPNAPYLKNISCLSRGSQTFRERNYKYDAYAHLLRLTTLAIDIGLYIERNNSLL